MKRLLAGAALLGTAVSAQAADLAVKAPYYKAPVLAVYDWTGFYFGGNVGVGLARNRTEQSFPGNTFDLTYLQPQGFIGGGQVGYNWQTNSSFLGLGPMVFGVEADIQGADMTDRRTALNGLAGINTTYDQRLGWFGTVRGRVGLTTGPVLTYVTAGYAYGNVRTTTTETAGAVTGVLNTDRMQDGYVIGSGVEAALGGNWTGKIEYLYLNLGNRNDGFTLFGTPQNLNSQIRENIFRIGLNYRIGGNSAYAALPAANWTGFYLGGNFGSGTGRDRSSLAIAGLTDTFNLAPDGILGGGQIGYNWQAASWVFGLEADFQASSQRDNRTCVATCTVANAALVRHRARPTRLLGRLDVVLRHRRLRLWQRQDRHHHQRPRQFDGQLVPVEPQRLYRRRRHRDALHLPRPVRAELDHEGRIPLRRSRPRHRHLH